MDLRSTVERVLNKNEDVVTEWKEGNGDSLNLLIGEVLLESNGSFDPGEVREEIIDAINVNLLAYPMRVEKKVSVGGSRAIVELLEKEVLEKAPEGVEPDLSNLPDTVGEESITVILEVKEPQRKSERGRDEELLISDIEIVDVDTSS